MIWSSRMLKRIYIFSITFFAVSEIAMAYEEPQFDIVQKNEIYEIRHYGERLVAQVNYDGENGGFRTLFNYISGANTSSDEIAMTVPVTQSVQIDMTVPVTQTQNNEISVMRFFLPSTYSKNNAPIPNNPNVEILTLPAEYLAVIRYSGFASDSNFREHASELSKALKKDGVQIIGSPIKATYNSPFTLPFFRRNEAMIKVNIPSNLTNEG